MSTLALRVCEMIKIFINSKVKSLDKTNSRWVIKELCAVLHRIRHEVQHPVLPHRMLLSSNGIFDVASP
ncbi:MAG: hypothetical protein VX434_07640 [Pseudomonadota bacterium]|nr:hypothetical protein [Pseudomonadota bacterium]